MLLCGTAVTIQRWPKLSPTDRVTLAMQVFTLSGEMAQRKFENKTISQQAYDEAKAKSLEAAQLVAKAEDCAGANNGDDTDEFLRRACKLNREMLGRVVIDPATVPQLKELESIVAKR